MDAATTDDRRVLGCILIALIAPTRRTGTVCATLDRLRPQLKDHFKRCGDVEYASVSTDMRTGRSKGVGLVEVTLHTLQCTGLVAAERARASH